MGERKVIRTTCKGCHGGCGVLATVEDGVIINVEGDPEGMTEGTMCAKGLSQLQHINNPYRIKYPIKRVGKKGEGKWERISWDEAIDTIVAKTKLPITPPMLIIILCIALAVLLNSGAHTSEYMANILPVLRAQRKACAIPNIIKKIQENGEPRSKGNE